ncbi:MAG: heme ABC exporter ATP-binding protein CcmA [Gammaproteobacteria bacterium]|nr:heme ABC exporter ATP-binding protein CcmA [Gammaproteobacteria bacterium]
MVNTTNAKKLLTISNLNVEVADKVLFPNLSLQVREGELVEIHGANGVGKSTLLRYIIGTRRSPNGTLIRVSDDVVYVGQKSGLNPTLTPLENLRWFTQITGSKRTPKELMGALMQVGLGSFMRTPTGALSAGQIRRCGLAKLVVSDAKLWVLDEPLTSLDASATEWLREAISEHRNKNGAVICATHASLGLPAATTLQLGEL